MEALWQLFDIQKERKDFAGALGTIQRILEAKPNPETLMEATFAD